MAIRSVYCADMSLPKMTIGTSFYSVDNSKTINHLSLCTGYEGIGIGLRKIWPNVREIAYVEIEAFAVANLAAKIEEGWIHPTPIYTDLKSFPFDYFLGKVDVLSAGFPCQPFSSAGRRDSTDDPRHLYPYIAEGISSCRPTYVVLENVEGIISSKTADGESVLKYVLGDLEERGYITSWGIFSAVEVGAPHQRKRVFIMAYRNCS
jgi:DNA (cytosine-5)-methyltransferase 1